MVAILVLAKAGFFPFPEFDKPQFEVNSLYIGPAPHNKPTAVVFVHGIFGTREDTWLNAANNTSFPALLGADPEFQKQIDIFVFEYFTPKFGNAGSIVDLADQLRGSLDDKRIFEDHQKVVFLSHSMGGLIVRQFLLSKRERLAQVSMLYFYATPTNGSELTTIAKQLSTNPQLRGMLPLEGNDLLQSIQGNWLGWEDVKKIPSYCALELLPTYGVMVVSRSSATALCNQELDPMSSNHIDIVKPNDRDDTRYSRFTNALRKTTTTHPQSRINPIDGLTYVYIPPGRFRMGCSPGDSECDKDEFPQHEVQITKGFWLGQTEVTNEAYDRFQKTTGSADQKQLPKVEISWDDARKFCEWSGGGLPTEAQWEYAARAGTTTPRYGPLDAVAWHFSNSNGQTHPVASKTPNAWRLYDMLGNVWEWTQDWFQSTYPAGEPQVDPPGPKTGEYRVLRGGAWNILPFDARSSVRLNLQPSFRSYGIGFRCRGETGFP